MSQQVHTAGERQRKQVFSGDRGRSNVPTGLRALPVTPTTVKLSTDRNSLQSCTLCSTMWLHTDSFLCTS